MKRKKQQETGQPNSKSPPKFKRDPLSQGFESNTHDKRHIYTTEPSSRYHINDFSVPASKGPEFEDLFTSGVNPGDPPARDYQDYRDYQALNNSSPYDHLISSSLGIYDPYKNVGVRANGIYGQSSSNYRTPKYDGDESYHNEIAAHDSQGGDGKNTSFQ